jgi:hypothetical protein
VNAHGKISLGGFTYAAGASYAGVTRLANGVGVLAEVMRGSQVAPRAAFSQDSL